MAASWRVKGLAVVRIICWISCQNIVGAEPGLALLLHRRADQIFHHRLLGAVQLHQGAGIVDQHGVYVFGIFLQAHGHEVSDIKGDTHRFQGSTGAADAVKMVHVQAEKAAPAQRKAGPVDPGLAAALQNVIHLRLLVELLFHRFLHHQLLDLDALFLVVHIVVGADIPVLLLLHCLRLLAVQGIYLYYIVKPPPPDIPEKHKKPQPGLAGTFSL